MKRYGMRSSRASAVLAPLLAVGVATVVDLPQGAAARNDRIARQDGKGLSAHSRESRKRRSFSFRTFIKTSLGLSGRFLSNNQVRMPRSDAELHAIYDSHSKDQLRYAFMGAVADGKVDHVRYLAKLGKGELNGWTDGSCGFPAGTELSSPAIHLAAGLIVPGCQFRHDRIRILKILLRQDPTVINAEYNYMGRGKMLRPKAFAEDSEVKSLLRQVEKNGSLD